jgi:hypothetical protein
VWTGAVDCGACRSLKEVALFAGTADAINLKITRGMTTTAHRRKNQLILPE